MEWLRILPLVVDGLLKQIAKKKKLVKCLR